MHIFDKFLAGDMENVDLNLNNPHFNERLSDNSINREDVINALLYEEVAGYDSGDNDNLIVYYTCEALNTQPIHDDHRYFKIVLAVFNNALSPITIMPETRLFRDNKSKKIDKKVGKNFSKRNSY